MGETKLAPLVLICIVALVVLLGVGFAFSYRMTQLKEAAPFSDNAEVKVFAETLSGDFGVSGDPVDDPLPNGCGKHS